MFFDRFEPCQLNFYGLWALAMSDGRINRGKCSIGDQATASVQRVVSDFPQGTPHARIEDTAECGVSFAVKRQVTQANQNMHRYCRCENCRCLAGPRTILAEQKLPKFQ